MNFADAAAQVLRENGGSLPVAEITQRAMKQGLISPKSDHPVDYVRAAIRKDNRRRESRGQPARFSLTAPGIYGLV
ncbi:MAG: winged helix-turn-helix domain-containing protein [Streptosporangiaceae bacterium]|nr:winged helix-turn-helix domain-containing protein [Streptosporangiaceae bacterium]